MGLGDISMFCTRYAKAKHALALGLALQMLLCSCQESGFNSNHEKIECDSIISLSCSNKEDFNIINKDQDKLLEIRLWDSKLGSVIIPIQDTFGIKLTFSNTSQIISKRSVKLINKVYVEDGNSYFFNTDGILSHIYQYKVGVLDGDFISYHPNGIVECKGYYKEGSKVGIWYNYDLYGKLIYTTKH